MQLRLVSPMAGFFDGADLLLAADCSAFARGDFHARYMKGKVTVIGCPKLDPVDYSEKLTEIFRLHNIRSVTLVRMGVPCCGRVWSGRYRRRWLPADARSPSKASPFRYGARFSDKKEPQGSFFCWDGERFRYAAGRIWAIIALKPKNRKENSP